MLQIMPYLAQRTFLPSVFRSPPVLQTRLKLSMEEKGRLSKVWKNVRLALKVQRWGSLLSSIILNGFLGLPL